MGKIIAVLSLKGGVGKTSSVVALGAAMADFGKRVLLVDANFSAPNLGMHLNLVNPEVTLHHVLNRSANINQAIYSYGDLDVIPCSIFHNLRISPLTLRSKIRPLKRRYDVILIDSSPALNEETLAAMFAADDLLIVTTPDLPTLSTTLKAIKIAKQRKSNIAGIILNKVYNEDFELSLEDIEDTAEVPVLAVIPHDLNVLRALSKAIPSTSHKKNSYASEEYKKLAATLIGEKYKQPRLRRYFKITPKRHEVNREIFYESSFG